MRLVLDTNVVLASIISPAGVCSRVLELVLEGAATAICSAGLEEEYREVLNREKFAYLRTTTALDPAIIIDALIRSAEIVAVSEIAPVVGRDPADDHVIACAVAGGADFIVSGDKHLLDLETWEGIEILRPRAMLMLLDARR